MRGRINVERGGLLTLALGEGEVDPFARELVFLVYILDEFFQVVEGFFGHFRFLFILLFRHGVDYSICSGVKPKGALFWDAFKDGGWE